jgi:hypothetical protein
MIVDGLLTGQQAWKLMSHLPRKIEVRWVADAGLKDYLVFLSIYQSLRRKGISLLRFLLSGETDLEKFVASNRRR